MAGWLARTGWHLATGGADGADTAFAAGAPAGRRTLWLPWPGYNGHRRAGLPRAVSRSELSACMDLAAACIPHGSGVRRAVRKLHARNVTILLSKPATGPSMPRCCMDGRGVVTGGTGMGIRIAEAHGIPVLNLGSMSPRSVCEQLAAIRRAAAAS